MQHTNDRAAVYRSLVSEPNPDQWRSLTQEDISLARLWVRREIRRRWALSTAVWVTVAATCAYYAVRTEPALFILVALATILWVRAMGSLAESVVDNLRPLGGDLDARKRVVVLSKHAEVLSYRNAVLAQGRELCVGDAKCMTSIAEDLGGDSSHALARGLAQQN